MAQRALPVLCSAPFESNLSSFWLNHCLNLALSPAYLSFACAHRNLTMNPWSRLEMIQPVSACQQSYSVTHRTSCREPSLSLSLSTETSGSRCLCNALCVAILDLTCKRFQDNVGKKRRELVSVAARSCSVLTFREEQERALAFGCMHSRKQ